MKNKWTSLFGVLAGLPTFLAGVGVTIPGKWGMVLSGAGMVGLGLSAKDHNVTGGTVEQ